MPKDEVDGDKRGVGLPQRQLGSDRADDLMRQALRGNSWQSKARRGHQTYEGTHGHLERWRDWKDGKVNGMAEPAEYTKTPGEGSSAGTS